VQGFLRGLNKGFFEMYGSPWVPPLGFSKVVRGYFKKLKLESLLYLKNPKLEPNPYLKN
jgi:hypothetical protein